MKKFPLLPLAFVSAMFMMAYIIYPLKQGHAYPPPPDQTSMSLNNGRITWSSKLDNAYYLENGTRQHFLSINVKAGDASREEARRAPLNLAVVVDRSGSMSGEKIDYAKQALHFIVNQLNSNDILSIVQYDDAVQVISPAQLVNNKSALHKIIDKIYVGGSTNLMGGTDKGYEQVLQMKRSSYVNRVLLLTDGLANVGITNPANIKRIVNNRFLENNIALSTFGLGADYNEDLLTLMAETGRGNYYYIDQPHKIAGIFAKELNGLLSIVAQNTLVKVKLPNGIHCENVYGAAYEKSNNEIIININDLYAKEERAILLQLKSNRNYFNQPIETALSFTDAADKKYYSGSVRSHLSATKDERIVRQNEDANVRNTVVMFKSTEELDDLMKDADERNFEAAKVKATATISKLKERQAVAPSPMLKKQEEQLTRYVEDLEKADRMSEREVKSMQKSNKASNYNMKKMK